MKLSTFFISFIFYLFLSFRNEKEVGEGVRKSGIKREDIYVVTKVDSHQHGYEEAIQGVKESLQK
jgi:diketogulonate reductase-like aldo/keto reductase